MRIPLCDLQAQYAELRPQIDAALMSAVAAGNYILGPNVRDFEGEAADYLQARFAVGLNSGTDALQLALRALDIGSGDEVITTPFTFIATSEAINMVGATPVFVDIDATTFCIDPELLEAAITPRTRAILPVHLYGHPCDMGAILKIARHHGLKVIEDCAQSMGARYHGKATGTLGDIGCFSFFPSKNLGCMGDGGMLVTNDEAVYERVEMLRRHGGKIKYHHTENGINSRLDDLQAAILRVKLPYLDAWNERRIRAAAYYSEQLLEIENIATAPAGSESGRSVFHQYTVRTSRRDELATELAESGINSAVYYPIPLHMQQANRELGYGAGDFPVAVEASRTCLSLPMHPHLDLATQKIVVAAIKKTLKPTRGAARAANSAVALRAADRLGKPIEQPSA